MQRNLVYKLLPVLLKDIEAEVAFIRVSAIEGCLSDACCFGNLMHADRLNAIIMKELFGGLEY
ncbi:hypothetical protein D3C71_2251360 [compost metagenome]